MCGAMDGGKNTFDTSLFRFSCYEEEMPWKDFFACTNEFHTHPYLHISPSRFYVRSNIFRKAWISFSKFRDKGSLEPFKPYIDVSFIVYAEFGNPPLKLVSKTKGEGGEEGDYRVATS